MEKKTKALSVVAIVFAIIGAIGFIALGWLTLGISAAPAIVGLILAIIARKKDPEDKLAKIAFIVSLVVLILGVSMLIGCAACANLMTEAIEESGLAFSFLTI